MWLYRGAQSAVFYYATCTPCANSIDQRKRRKEAARAKREKEKASALVTDQPRPFAQPPPFSTNEGWNEEIALGPGPPARRGGARHHLHRPGSWNTDTLSAQSSAPSNRDLDGGAEAPRKDSKGRHALGDRWNRMRFQREDEPLWGENVDGRGGPSAGISGGARSSSSSKYSVARVPPVNDLHPPIVSGPKSRAETRWMLQPPPSARVMAGKEPVRTIDENAPGIERKQSSPTGSPNTRKSPSPNAPSIHKRETNAPIKPPPIALRTDNRIHKTTSAEANPRLPRLPQPALSSSSPKSVAAFGRDESNFVIPSSRGSRSSSLSTISSQDSENQTPSTPWQFPNTPVSPPVSKVANANMSHAAFSKALSSLPRDGDKKDVHLVHLEINDDSLDDTDDDVGFGKLKQSRPWRWSMDI